MRAARQLSSMPRQPMRRRRHASPPPRPLLTCCTPCVALHLPTRRPARTTRAPRRGARREAAGRSPTVDDVLDAARHVDDTKPQLDANASDGPRPRARFPRWSCRATRWMTRRTWLWRGGVVPRIALGRDPQRRLRHENDDSRGRRGGFRRRRALQRRLPLGHGQLWVGDARLRPGLRRLQGHHGAPWTITHRSTFNNVHKIARMACPLTLLAPVCS